MKPDKFSDDAVLTILLFIIVLIVLVGHYNQKQDVVSLSYKHKPGDTLAAEAYLKH